MAEEDAGRVPVLYLVEAAQGSLPVARLLEKPAEIAERIRQLRVQAHGVAVRLNGLGAPAEFGARVAEVIVCLDERRLQRRCHPVEIHGLLSSVQLTQRIPHVAIGLGKVVVYRQRVSIVLDALVPLALGIAAGTHQQEHISTRRTALF